MNRGFSVRGSGFRAAVGGATWALLVASALAQQSGPLVVESTVTGFSADRGIVSLSVGQSNGTAVSDRFWVFGERGIQAAGQLQLVSETGSGGATEGEATATVGQPAAVLRSAALPSCGEALPPQVTIRGRITRVAPGRRSAWIDLGAGSGLKVGDTLLVRRSINVHFELPLARGRIEIVREDTALAVLEPIVSNTLPQPGDVAELWPSPSDRRHGRVESTVLDVTGPEDSELTLTLVGTAEDGFAIGRLVDLFHGRDYVGHAYIEHVGSPNSRAKTVRAGQKLKPQPGDRAWVRPPPGPPPMPISVAIFQLKESPQGDFAQLAAGDTDGVRLNERFIVRHEDPADPTIRREIAELTVNRVQDDFSTARIRPLVSVDDDKVLRWDFAERQDPPMPDWRAIGIVQRVMPETRSAVATLEPRSAATTGRLIRWTPGEQPPDQPARPAGAAIVIHRTADEAVLYVPPGWGNVEFMMQARVELADSPAARSAPQPASRPE